MADKSGSGTPSRGEIGTLSGILDPDVEPNRFKDVTWRKRNAVRRALDDFNDDPRFNLKLDMPSPLASGLGIRRVVTVIADNPDVFRFFLNPRRESVRRLLTMTEAYAPRVRFVDDRGGQEVNVALEQGRFRSVDMLRNPRWSPRRFRMLLDEVHKGQQAVRVTADDLREFVQGMERSDPGRLKAILARTGAGMYTGRGSLEFYPVGESGLVAPVGDEALVGAFLQNLLARVRLAVAQFGRLEIDEIEEPLTVRLARRHVDPRELTRSGLAMREVQGPPMKLVFARIEQPEQLAVRAPAGNAADRPAVAVSAPPPRPVVVAPPVRAQPEMVGSVRDKLLERVRKVLADAPVCVFSEHGDALNYRLARQYLTDLAVKPHGFRRLDYPDHLEFVPVARNFDGHLKHLSLLARKRLRQALVQVQVTGDSVPIAADDEELQRFLARPDVREALERDKGLCFIAPGDTGENGGPAYLTRMLML